VQRSRLPALAWLGVVGLAGVHATYFLAIDRLQIGVAVTIQYLAPLLLLVWLRIAHRRRLAASLWGAVLLSVVGCFLVVRAYAGRLHEPVTTLFWAFGFATLFWTIVTPWWGFPGGELDSARNALLALGVVLIGTLLPFICMVAALRHVPAPRAAVVATLEPVLAAVFAWVIHDEALAAVQVAGGLAVVGAVLWVQSRRADLEQELAPPARALR
jgi:drug/metabolite transporter (DMT)-like permease